MDIGSQADSHNNVKSLAIVRLAGTIDNDNNDRHTNRPYNSMSAQSFTKFIQAEPALKPLLQQLSELDYIQGVFRKCVPVALARLGKVGSFQNGTLVVIANNGAAAAKLKQAVPELKEKMSQLAQSPIEIKVSVFLDNVGEPAKTPRKDKPALSPAAIESLGKLAAALPASELKDEVATLLQRQGRRRNENGD